MSELEATVTVDASIPTGDTSGEAVSETKDAKEKKNVEEKSHVEEMKDAEKKEDVEEKSHVDVKGKKDAEKKEDVEEKSHVEETKAAEEKDDVEENGAEAAGNEEEGEEERGNEDLSMEEVEHVKVKGGDDVKEEGGKEGEEGKVEKMEEGNDEKEQKGDIDAEDVVGEKKEANGLNRRRGKRKKGSKDGEVKEVKGAKTKEKKLFSTPKASSIERPVRERKTVERLVEVIEKGPVVRHFKIEKGNGTPLKDIPNVAYKLSRKKPADLKLVHQTLFGRRAKITNFRSHILQFSGFVWHENEDKQRAKIKEKLDKYVKDTLLDLCDLFDIPAAKATTRKEDLVVKLLDFLSSPHATTDVVLAEKEQQSTKSSKRKRVAIGRTPKSSRGTPVERSRKKRMKTEETSKGKEKNIEETEDEDDEEEDNGASDEDVTHKHSDSELEEKSESEEAEEEVEIPDKGKKNIKRSSSKQAGSYRKEKVKAPINSKKAPLSPTTDSTLKRSSSKSSKVEDTRDVGTKVASRRKKDVDLSKKKTPSKSDSKEKPTGKSAAKVKAKSEAPKDSGPSQKALRAKICEILKEVDFNTATFTDILNKLSTHYEMDLTSRKKSIKLMIQEELTKLADEAEEDEDNEEEGGA